MLYAILIIITPLMVIVCADLIERLTSDTWSYINIGISYINSKLDDGTI